jgi:hypothetical protein
MSTPQGSVRQTRRSLLLLAGLLARLTCQACGAVGKTRYWPRFTHSIDVDLDPTAQGRQAKRLAEILRASRERVEADPLFVRVLIFHDDKPRQRLVDILRRAELRHETSEPNRTRREPNRWLLAIWLAEAIHSWRGLQRRLALHARRAQRQEQDVAINNKLEALRKELVAVRDRRQSQRMVVLEAYRLLCAPESSEIVELLAHHYAEEKRSDDLAQYRFRSKAGQD